MENLGKTSYGANVLENIEKYGWSFTSVFGDESKGEVSFGYTIGLTKTFNHPELIIFGLDPKTSHALVGNAIRKIENGTLKIGEANEDIIEGFDCFIKEAKSELSAEYALSAVSFNGKENFKACQLVWPDENKKFPWEEGFNKEMLEFQKKLW